MDEPRLLMPAAAAAAAAAGIMAVGMDPVWSDGRDCRILSIRCQCARTSADEQNLIYTYLCSDKKVKNPICLNSCTISIIRETSPNFTVENSSG